jgi:DNA-binding IclR family transcriptional regulator
MVFVDLLHRIFRKGQILKKNWPAEVNRFADIENLLTGTTETSYKFHIIEIKFHYMELCSSYPIGQFAQEQPMSGGKTRTDNKKADPFRQKGAPKATGQTALKEGAQSIQRAILLLRTVAESQESGSRLFQIAEKVGLPTTTVHRILAVLVAEGLIEYDPATKFYHIGIGLYVLGNQARRFALREKYRTCLENISHETSDSVYLVVKSGFDALCIDSIEGRSTIRIMTYRVGSRRPLGIGAGSLALLAFSKAEEIELVLTANRFRYNDYKLSLAQIRDAIGKARSIGYAFSKGHYIKGVNGVGIPLYDGQGNVTAAISVASIADRIDLKRSRKIADLIESEISVIT